MKSILSKIPNVQLVVAFFLSLVQAGSLILVFIDKISEPFWYFPYLYATGIYLLLAGITFMPLYSRHETGIYNLDGTKNIKKTQLISCRLRIYLLLANTVIFLVILVTVTMKLASHKEKQILLSPWASLGTFFAGAEAANVSMHLLPNDKIKVRWELVDNFCSLSAKKDMLNNLSVSPDNEITGRIFSGQGKKLQNQDDENYDRIFEFLHNQCIKLNHKDYLNRLGASKYDANLVELAKQYPKIVNDLCCSKDIYQKLPPEEQALVQQYFIRYIGQWVFKLRLTVDNTAGSQDIQIYKFRYEITATGNFKSVLAPAVSFPTYSLTIPYKKGIVEFAFATQGNEIAVEKGRSKTFDLVLGAGKDAPRAATWDGTVSLVSNIGNIPVGRLSLMLYSPYKKLNDKK